MNEQLRNDIMNCVWDIQDLSESIGNHPCVDDYSRKLYDMRVEAYKRLLHLLHGDNT